MEMILTYLDFFRQGLPTHTKKISFLGGPAHFMTYGDDGGDGQVDGDNALTTMASALITRSLDGSTTTNGAV
jgi:hypothetical protein